MTLLVLLTTACALFGAVAVVSALLARRWAADALHSERRLLHQRGVVMALETSVESWERKLRVLHGRVSAHTRWGDEQPIEIVPPFAQGLVCENYTTAQRDGPQSAAAKCECEYCEGKRAERAALRAKHVPKTAQEFKNAIEKGRH